MTVTHHGMVGDGDRIVLSERNGRNGNMTDIIEHETVEELAVVPGFTVAAHTLRDMLTAGLLAAGKDNTLPTLASVRLEWDRHELRVVATDRYRLMVATANTDERNRYVNAGDGEVLINHKDAADLVKALPKVNRNGAHELVRVSVVAGSVLIDGNGWSRSLTVLIGEFPKYRTFIPTEFAPVDNVAYNPKFLADIGKIPVDKGTPVRFRFVSETRPMVALLDGANGVSEYMYMLMPVRIAK